MWHAFLQITNILVTFEAILSVKFRIIFFRHSGANLTNNDSNSLPPLQMEVIRFGFKWLYANYGKTFIV